MGPATATLMLSVHDPENVPFFEDELYEWVCCTPGGGAKAKAKTKTKLKYDMKEYRQLSEQVGRLRDRLHVRADEVEKVAYVIGHLDVLPAEEKEEELDAAVQKKCTFGTRGQDGVDGAAKAENLGAKGVDGSSPESDLRAKEGRKSNGRKRAAEQRTGSSDSKRRKTRT